MDTRPNRNEMQTKTSNVTMKHKKLDGKNERVKEPKHIGFSFLKPLWDAPMFIAYYLPLPLPLPPLLLTLFKRKCRHCLHSLALLTGLLLLVVGVIRCRHRRCRHRHQHHHHHQCHHHLHHFLCAFIRT